MTDPTNPTGGTPDEIMSNIAANVHGSNGGATPKNGSHLEEDLKRANQQIQDLTETAKRALADLQNYRKRVEEERTSFSQFASASLVLELLPILDNFNRAFSQVPEEITKTEWFKGTLQIEQQLVGVLKKRGVAEMPSSVGQQVDLNKHEAVAAGPGAKDTVIEEYEKGYLMGDKMLRPAKVKVGDGNPAK